LSIFRAHFKAFINNISKKLHGEQFWGFLNNLHNISIFEKSIDKQPKMGLVTFLIFQMNNPGYWSNQWDSLVNHI
jgi:hypothetical protein